MNKLNQTLSEVLDVEPIGSTELLPATPVTKVDDDADLDEDDPDLAQSLAKSRRLALSKKTMNIITDEIIKFSFS